MSMDLYNQGYSQYMREPLPDSVVKSNPPQWRAGYKAAKKNADARDKVAAKPEKVDKVDYSKFTITWQVVTFVTRTPRFHIFSKRPQLYPILSQIRKELWNSRSECLSFKELQEKAHNLLDNVLQNGYDLGILSEHDCSIRGYKVKKLQ